MPFPGAKCEWGMMEDGDSTCKSRWSQKPVFIFVDTNDEINLVNNLNISTVSGSMVRQSLYLLLNLNRTERSEKAICQSIMVSTSCDQ